MPAARAAAIPPEQVPARVRQPPHRRTVGRPTTNHPTTGRRTGRPAAWRAAGLAECQAVLPEDKRACPAANGTHQWVGPPRRAAEQVKLRPAGPASCQTAGPSPGGLPGRPPTRPPGSPANRRTAEPPDWRTAEPPNRRAGGLAGWRAGGLAGWRAGGLAGWRAGGLAGWRGQEISCSPALLFGCGGPGWSGGPDLDSADHERGVWDVRSLARIGVELAFGVAFAALVEGHGAGQEVGEGAGVVGFG
ncbi:hypothetical protein SAMN05216174_106147 [Actinokineospora iranica]|uniref:Uncharacterized protein n=1 Tax=Actinokineospora iranica TaxID=1271860 RepID=A0A1G6R6A6_9PSEU|nr:hypothetical protein SAMN05216174_106147 [Actinokineospora iranica]